MRWFFVSLSPLFLHIVLLLCLSLLFILTFTSQWIGQEGIACNSFVCGNGEQIKWRETKKTFENHKMKLRQIQKKLYCIPFIVNTKRLFYKRFARSVEITKQTICTALQFNKAKRKTQKSGCQNKHKTAQVLKLPVVDCESKKKALTNGENYAQTHSRSHTHMQVFN